MLSLDAEGRGSVLQQFGKPDSVDSPRKALPSLRERVGGGKGEGGGPDRGREEELG